jgi:hypothetical protein
MTITLNGTTGITTPDVSTTTETLSGGTANGVAYLNASKVVTAGSALTFDGTNLATTGSVSTPNTFGFKNRIINGAMRIAQRNTSGTSGSAVPTTAPVYPCVDRFYAYATGATVTASQTTVSAINYLSIAGAASVTAVGIGQRIEAANSFDLAGSTATLSLNISNSLLTTVTWTASYATSNDTWSAKTQIATGTFTVTSTLTNYSAQITVPSAATTGIEILLTVGAQISGTWVIGNVQLEKSAIATSFDYRPYGIEMVLCQRYFEKSYDTTTAIGTVTNTGLVQARAMGGGQFGSGYLQVPFAVEKRTTPSITRYSPNTGASGNVYLTDPAGDGNYTPMVYISTRNFNYGNTSNILNAGGFIQMQWAALAEL